MVRFVTEILDVGHVSGLKTYNISRARYASIFSWNGENGLHVPVGPLERTGLNTSMCKISVTRTSEFCEPPFLTASSSPKCGASEARSLSY
jgi:hypothetical protein